MQRRVRANPPDGYTTSRFGGIELGHRNVRAGTRAIGVQTPSYARLALVFPIRRASSNAAFQTEIRLQRLETGRSVHLRLSSP